MSAGPRPLRRPPANAPWGRRGSVYNFDTVRFLGEYLSPGCLRMVQVAAHTLDRQLAREGGGVSLGFVAMQAATAFGAPEDVSQRCAVLVDILHLALDLADNVADEEQDRLQGRSLDTSYPGVARESLVALPALMIGAVVSGVHSNFPDPFHPSYAARRIMEMLDVLTRGQSLELDDPMRVEMLSAVEGRLFALPWWLMDGAESDFGEVVEAWGVAYARTWQARRNLLERPGEEVWEQRYRDAAATARACWPDRPGFRPGEFLAFADAVPDMP